MIVDDDDDDDINFPTQSYDATDVVFSIGELSAEGQLLWVPYRVPAEGVDHLVFALVAARMSLDNKQFVDAAIANGYEVQTAPRFYAIDLRGMWASVKLEYAIDPYLAERGSFADVYPCRAELLPAARSTFPRESFAIKGDVVRIVGEVCNLPYFIEQVPQATRLDVVISCKIEFHSGYIKWLDFSISSRATPTPSGMVSYVTVAVVPDGHMLRFHMLSVHSTRTRIGAELIPEPIEN